MKKNILIVDDDIPILNSLKYILANSGYTVFTATSAAEAFDVILKNQISLIILDLHIPWQDGVSICKEIRKQSKHKETPILAYTAYTGAFLDKKKEMSDLFTEVLTKPTDMQVLIQKVNKYIKTSE